MSGLEELKKKLAPLFDAEKGFSSGSTLDPYDSYMLSDSGTVNLLSRSYGVYNINELGLQKCTSSPVDDTEQGEKTYRCASHEMRIFGAIGSGASSVVQRAMHIPSHRILALKKINIFEKVILLQRCTCLSLKGPCGIPWSFLFPDSGQISIALEYMDGGSLADILRLRKSMPEPVLSSMFQKLLQGLNYLHGVRHLVHRDIKPANLLVNLKGEPKITDFGISAGLDNSMAMCATFVGTVTYMSPERIRNDSYSYPADIWSLGLALFECGTGEFPYTANEGPVNLMLQILDDPSPSPPKDKFSLEFCSFIDACLQKDADGRPTAEQLLSHPFIKKHEHAGVDLAAFVRSVFDPTQRLKDLADAKFALRFIPIRCDRRSSHCDSFQFVATGEVRIATGEVRVAIHSNSLRQAKFALRFIPIRCDRRSSRCDSFQIRCDSFQFVATGEVRVAIHSKFVAIGEVRVANVDITLLLTIDGPDENWQHARTLYNEDSTFSFSGKQFVGPNDIHAMLSSIRSTLAGDWPPEKLVHVVEKLQCRAHGQDGVAIRVRDLSSPEISF
ncbi:Mitogen-activated protein kinase kinase 3 [Hibiscus syriacus]|uniref:mitogen-activated protein kinase kinase n=1 Tax=Hibiscus syriacus TaxID=106335 RepID=A0A6A3A5P5_HIBSY|nr:Mitogen-activated protein kinase kinase 3 [Hibiscus syriacus]